MVKEVQNVNNKENREKKDIKDIKKDFKEIKENNENDSDKHLGERLVNAVNMQMNMNLSDDEVNSDLDV